MLVDEYDFLADRVAADVRPRPLMRLLGAAALVVAMLATPCCDRFAHAQIKLLPEYQNGQAIVIEVTYPDAPEGALPLDPVWDVGDSAYVDLAPGKIALWPKFGTADRSLRITFSGPLVTADGKYVPGSNRKFEAITKLVGIGLLPPGPGPGPGPEPEPLPVPTDPAPIPEPGFRVLVVWESSEKQKMQHIEAMQAKSVIEYLNSKCVKVEGQPEFRYLDKDTPGTAGVWTRALKRAEGKPLPWIIISTGKTGFEGPLPEGQEAMLELLKKYGG